MPHLSISGIPFGGWAVVNAPEFGSITSPIPRDDSGIRGERR